MGLAAGTKFGPYEIQSPLGAGGMGEVYRARDSRLGRDVAIKILPANLSSDSALRLRLEREAKAISRLTHPHICTLYDIGHQDGVDFLVLELVEGETLAQRLFKGPLPLEQTLRIASQIAQGLARAHRLGITHRDLKPSNIMLTKSGAKLMDFGLAKESPLSSPAMAEATAEELKLTTDGTIVGTFQYMAPEQLEGKETDARTDLFALGAVIYEMTTGKAAFEAKSRAGLIAAILTSEPLPICAREPMTPPALERVVRKCLAKDPDERWQTASDLASELDWISEGGRRVISSPAPRARWQYASWAFAGALLVLAVVAGVAWWQARNSHPRPMHFSAQVPLAANDLALSPDGTMLAMIGYSARTNSYMLWTSEIGGQGAKALDGTQGASYPFWSTDGRFIAFFADGKLKKVDVAGGQPQVLCDAPNGRGGSWNRDGVIIFAPDSPVGLSRVSALGGTPAPLTKPDSSRLESSHRWPMFLPDGNHFLYLAANFIGEMSNNTVFLGSLDSPERHPLVNSSGNAAYVEPGYLLYLHDRTLVAQKFDLRRYAVSGEPHLINEEVMYFPQVFRAVFSASGAGVLVTQDGKSVVLSQLTWFDRSGKEVGILGAPGAYNNVRLSPDDRSVAEDQTDVDGRNIDVWVLGSNAPRRLTFDPALDQAPIWSPNGKQVLYDWTRSAGNQLFLKNADGSGTEEQVSDQSERLIVPWDWSRNGQYILFRKATELWYLTWPDRTLKPYLQTKWTVRNAQFSPDGKWVVYASNETGSMEIYVSPFPNADSKWQVSSRGGEEPRWRGDGRELFYVSPEGMLMAVPVAADSGFTTGSSVPLFQIHRRPAISAQDVFSYDVSKDGQRVLVITKANQAASTAPSVVLNWTSEFEK